jgi:hypothetical protein
MLADMQAYRNEVEARIKQFLLHEEKKAQRRERDRATPTPHSFWGLGSRVPACARRCVAMRGLERGGLRASVAFLTPAISQFT